jgi:hypothetical protein
LKATQEVDRRKMLGGYLMAAFCVRYAYVYLCGKVADIANDQETLLEVPFKCQGQKHDLWSWTLTVQSVSVNVNTVHCRILVVRLTSELNLTLTAERSTN